jgi:RND family efflux transporter MFP subunit
MIRRIIAYGITLTVAMAAGWLIWDQYQNYLFNPWTRDAQVRANVVGIAPRVEGPISQVAVRDNQFVRKGDLLFAIDPADFEAAVEQAEAQVQALASDVLQAKQELDRQTNLFQKKVNPVRDFQNAQDAYATARANLAAAEANLKTTKLKLSYTKIYATVNGQVTNVDISPGHYAAAGQQVMALIDSDSYWIAAYFKEDQIFHIRPGDAVKMTLMGQPDSMFTGVVQSIGWGIFVTDGSAAQATKLLPEVSPTVDWVRLPQRFPVRIRPTPAMPLRVGETVSVQVGSRNQHSIPQPALSSINP